MEVGFEIQIFLGKMPENPIQLLRRKGGGKYINPGKRRMRKKLDRVGPVDNRPSPNKIHHFVQKNERTARITT